MRYDKSIKISNVDKIKCNILIFDTETTGLFHTKDKPKEGIKKARNPMVHPEDYPRVFQLAYIIVNELGEIQESFSEFIKPDGWIIPTERDEPDKPNFWEEHNYSTSQCEEIGVPAIQAYTKFIEAIDKSDYLVAHNLSYDKPVILAEIKRYNIPLNKKKPKSLCTMRSTIDFVEAKHSEENIKKWPFLEGKNKFPKLSELHIKLFGKDFDGAHNAEMDLVATFDCMRELFKRGIMYYDSEFIDETY